MSRGFRRRCGGRDKKSITRRQGVPGAVPVGSKVDTSAWIDYFRGIVAPHTDTLDSQLQTNRIIIGDLIIIELLQGFKTKKEYDQARKLIEKLEYRDLVGRTIALQSAENFRILRSKGITVRKTIDVIIATFCIENGFQIIHNDRDFDPMEKYLGLKVKK